MERFINYLWSFIRSRPEDATVIAGLTGDERRLITKSWSKVMLKPTENGTLFFLRLFEIQPKHRSVFPFKNVPTKDLPADKKFQAHVNSVMYSISSIINNLQDEELLLAILNKIGTSHSNRSVDRQALIDVKQALLDTFKIMGQQELAAWLKLLEVLVDVVSKTIEDKLEENKQ